MAQFVLQHADEGAAALIESYDPATLEKIGTVRPSSASDVAQAVDRARGAQARWAAVPVVERGKYLLRVRDHLIDNMDRVATLISRENGKPKQEALYADVFPVIYLIDYFAKNAPRLLADSTIDIRIWRFLRRSSLLNRAPRGVVGIISPWNFPFTIPAGEICMALMAGNAAVLKPARATALVGELVGEIYNSVGLPEHLVQVVQGSGSALMAQKLDFIAFTGSVDVGKQIMQQAARNLTPVMLELGGKDPMIICEDANLEVAAAAAMWGAFSNAGQMCSSVERVYVHHKVADTFTRLVLDKTRKLRQGHGLDPNVDIGAMCTQEQYAYVIAQVDRARAQGATILTGGETNPAAGPGYFYKPTVMTHVGQDWECMQDETFGPTLPIVTYRDDAEAVRLANDSKYGLCASVWTRNIRKGEAMARQIVSGSVLVNDVAFTHSLAETPWGGPKDTGIGRTHGREGLLEFTESRHIHINRNTGMKNLWSFPYTPAGLQLFKSTGLMFRSGIRHKARGARGALGALRGTIKSQF